MVGVQLPNGEFVGVATAFAMPDLFDGISSKDALAVQRLVGEAEQADEPYRSDVRAKNWIGAAVAKVLDLDLDKKHEKARAKAVAKQWLENDVLRHSTWLSKRDGREVPVVIVGEWITREEAGL